MDDQENGECNENEIKIEKEIQPTVPQETEDLLLKPLNKTVKKSECQNDTSEQNEDSSLCADEQNQEINPAELPETGELFLKPVSVKNMKKKQCQIDSVKKSEENILCSEELNPLCKEKNSEKKVKKSPSQKMAEKEIPIPYKEPSWSGLPHYLYEFEVIKNGVVIERIPFQKPYLVVGRLSNCDIIMEHPSISRFHCVIQYRREETENETKGVYVYDLESTHGTFRNKRRLLPKLFSRLKVGHILKFGGSSRLFILHGPAEDEQPEYNLTVTEYKAKTLELLKWHKNRPSLLKLLEKDDNSDAKEETSEGIDWGMGEDAVEEDDEESSVENPFASNEDLFLNDPKKTLRGWYEREGFDLPDYKVEETRPGSFKAKLELPVSGSNEKSITCVIEHKGKKKEAVVQCALEACRILDRQGLLRQAVHEGHEKKRKNWSENDYYDSDEDDFLDRTGDIERKRIQRKKELEAAKGVEEVETYDSLKGKYNEVISTLEELEANLKKAELLKTEQNEVKSDSLISDDLDSYMQNLSTQLPDKHKRAAWKIEVIKLSKEEARLRRLVNVARPLGVAEIPERKSLYSESKKNIFEQPSKNKSFSKKVAPVQKIHQAFLEEEEDMKPKLRKVDCSLEDDNDLAPVPYSKPQKVLSKYEQKKSFGIRFSRFTKSEEMDVASPLNCVKQSKTTCDEIIPTVSEVNMEISDNSTNISNEEDRLITLNEKMEDENSSTDTSPQNIRIIGPSLPGISTDSIEFSQPSVKPIKKKKLKTEAKNSLFDFEEKYENWVPPKGQTGDGRTSLNEKLGY